jgi:ABC-type bacteriocin/lantibiotic exporter with double-glycine peptidase domain
MNILPGIISMLIECRVSLKRIYDYLTAEELDEEAVEMAPLSDRDVTAVTIKNAKFQWIPDSARPTLSILSCEIPRGKLVAIVGSVGSGKSSFLSALLGEVPKQSGTVQVKGSIASAPQQAWIQNGKWEVENKRRAWEGKREARNNRFILFSTLSVIATLRDNILFGSAFVKEKYDMTIRVCELESDLAMLPNGDMTEIGEKGINLRFVL